MKKLVLILAAVLMTASLFAVSYKNNTYQKLADEYTQKAEKAMDAGEYDDAIKYSEEAQKNAELSKAFVARMLAMGEAEDNIKLAKNRLAWAEKIDAPNIYPMAYTAAKENLANAETSFDAEEWGRANEYA